MISLSQPDSCKPESYLFYQSRQRRPILDHGHGVYLWDTDGKRYLDGSSGAMVSNIGHSNAYVLAAMKAQMDKATFGYRLHFETEASEALAKKTVALMPEGLDRVFFVSGGSEAVESSLKFARQWALATNRADKWKIISRFPSYHGSTLGALAITGMTPMSQPFAPMMREMPKVPAPTCYLDHDDLDHEQRGLRYAELLKDEILRQGSETVLAFIMEPIGGASTGALVAPDSYYRRVQQICKEFDVLLIADEVMTGGGRTGKFLGGDHWNLKPDLIAMSKGFAAGYAPLGAMVARGDMVEKVLDAGGFIHGFTYAGNPLACATGLAVLEEMENKQLIGRAQTQGDKLRQMLAELMNKYPFIGDVRGKGLLLAFELMADRISKAPLPRSLNAYIRLVEIAYKNGLILYSRRTRGGLEGDHFMVCPPLIITDNEMEHLLELLDKSLFELAKELDLPLGTQK
ncbi:MAG: adenosylmethionine-8-amino-7-oxononanoate aminotransferase [Gammaproteobacteria bacterium]|jgi:adenosylmethionine-8-amino-7-oxononanoate aminotransferase